MTTPDDTLTPRVRITGDERSGIGRRLRAAYEEGSSIRALSQRFGRSYGFVHRVLLEAGTPLRKRGGAHL